MGLESQKCMSFVYIHLDILRGIPKALLVIRYPYLILKTDNQQIQKQTEPCFFGDSISVLFSDIEMILLSEDYAHLSDQGGVLRIIISLSSPSIRLQNPLHQNELQKILA